MGWLLLNGMWLKQSPGLDVFGFVVLLTLGAFALLCRGGWSPRLGVAVRILMAADFLFAVADRFGTFGPAGTPGVGWGDFEHFVGYTCRCHKVGHRF